jgi:hypothetical protein
MVAPTCHDSGESLLSRCEADVFAPRAAARDPYAAWLEQREAEAQRDAPQIRWVYRHESPGRDDAEDGLVTA